MPLDPNDWVATIDATSKDLTPTARITATNMTNILASEAQAKAGTVNDEFMTPARVAVRDEKYDVRRSGVTMNGTTNDATNLNAAMAVVAAADRGTAFLPSDGVCAIAAAVTIPDRVNLVGEGTAWDSGNDGSILLCTNAAAKLIIEGSGGETGGFTIDGNDLATGPLLQRDAGADREFHAITLRNSDGEALRIEEAQNDHWTQVHCVHSVGPLLILDKGAGGHKFESCEYGGTEGWHVVIVNSATGGLGGNIGPSFNTWERCFLEYSKFGSADIFSGCLDVHSGRDNKFRDCIMSAVGNETTVAVVRVNTDAAVGTPASSVLFDNVIIAGPTVGSLSIGILQTAGQVRLHGHNRLEGLTNGWKFDGGTARIADETEYVGVTNRWHASSAGTIGNVIDYRSRPVQVLGESTDAFLARFFRYGDTGTRLDVTPNGNLSWGAGSGAPDTTLFRNVADQLRTTDEFVADIGLRVVGGTGPLIRGGTGTPEGAVTAPIGSLFLRTDGGAGTTLYVKESGAGNTGWVAK